jgi:hypothetical protein
MSSTAKYLLARVFSAKNPVEFGFGVERVGESCCYPVILDAPRNLAWKKPFLTSLFAYELCHAVFDIYR